MLRETGEFGWAIPFSTQPSTLPLKHNHPSSQIMAASEVGPMFQSRDFEEIKDLPTCYNCLGKGHWARECPSEEGDGSRNGDGVCHNCWGVRDKEGNAHRFSDCASKFGAFSAVQREQLKLQMREAKARSREATGQKRSGTAREGYRGSGNTGKFRFGEDRSTRIDNRKNIVCRYGEGCFNKKSYSYKHEEKTNLIMQLAQQLHEYQRGEKETGKIGKDEIKEEGRDSLE